MTAGFSDESAVPWESRAWDRRTVAAFVGQFMYGSVGVWAWLLKRTDDALRHLISPSDSEGFAAASDSHWPTGVVSPESQRQVMTSGGEAQEEQARLRRSRRGSGGAGRTRSTHLIDGCGSCSADPDPVGWVRTRYQAECLPCPLLAS